MTRIMIAALMMVGVARAEGPCRGMTPEQVNKIVGAWDMVVGTQPVKTQIETCGGGISPVGDVIVKWKCFIQTWKIRFDSTPGRLIFAYQVKNNRWSLTLTRICKWSEEECEPFDTPQCNEKEEM